MSATRVAAAGIRAFQELKHIVVGSR